MNSIFLKTEYGVTVELRQRGSSNKQAWLDYTAREWKQVSTGMWQSTGYGPILGKEIGRWTTTANVDVYAAVERASTNDAGFRNWNR